MDMDESSLSIVVDNLGVLQLIMKERFLWTPFLGRMDIFISKSMELNRFYNKHYENKTLEASVAAVTSAAVEAQVIISDFIHHVIRRKEEEQKGFLNKAIYFLNDLIIARKKNADEKLESIIQVINRVFEGACSSTTTTGDGDGDGDGDDDKDILFVGREHDIQVIQNKLISAIFSIFGGLGVISIVGMTGVGKTCLARKIYNSQQVTTHFDCLAWICARDHFPTVELLKAIAEQMGYSLEAERFTVHRFNDFLREKRYLIVIDGVLTYEPWVDYLTKALSCRRKRGSRILFTTQEQRNPSSSFVNEHDIHRLGPLNDAQSWELFSKTVSPETLDLLSSSSYKNEIIKKCDGFPQAILHLANKLSKETDHEGFQLVLIHTDDVFLGQPWTSHTVLDTIVSNLPSHLKHCLFYFRCFPKNSKIPSRRLIALWVAEGLVEKEGYKEPEVIARGYLEELIRCKMIQVVKYSSNQTPKKCRLAYFQHEHSLFTTLSGKPHLYQASSSSISSSSSGGTKGGVSLRLADHADHNDEDIASLEHNSSLILSFLSFDYREGPAPGERVGNFLYGAINKRCFRLLRVLDLERVYKPVLPKEIGRLIHLRYLGLRWTYLETLPSSILNLKYLQTLDIKHTYINTLPEPLWDLINLRHLYLNEIQLAQSQCMPRHLQTLWGIFLSEEDPLDKFLLESKITRLGLVCHLPSNSDQEEMAICILRQNRLQKLMLTSKDRLSKPLNLRLKHFTNHGDLSDLNLFGRLEKLLMVHEFPPNLTELTLSASNLKEDPMPTLEMLPKLTFLRLYADTYIGKRMVCSSSSGFSELQILKIWKLKQLEEWVVEEGSMPVLRMLEIRACNSLSKLPERFQEITTLVELKISDMPREFTAKVKQNKDKEWYKKANVCFIDWEARNSNMEAASSSTFSASPSFGSILLLFFLLDRLSASPTKHSTRVQGLPALGCVRCYCASVFFSSLLL